MEILWQAPLQTILFFILYGVTGVVPLLAVLYLWLCRGRSSSAGLLPKGRKNAIAPGVTPPVRLRRWAACFFSVAVLDHVWWLLFCIFFGDIRSMDDLFHSAAYWATVIIDYLAMLTTLVGTLLSMLQDRRRPVWPVFLAMIPIVALGGVFMVRPDMRLHQVAVVYLVLLYVLFAVYMVFAVRRYVRWLNDNYADLENKRVWLILMVTLACLLLFILYTFVDINTPLLMFLMHFTELVLFVLLLWLVETLPQLDGTSTEEVGSTLTQETSNLIPDGESARPSGTLSPERTRSLSPLNSGSSQPAAPVNIDLAQIERLLNERCVAPKLYLKHDLSLQELAQAVGTNRYYLGQYFSRQSITYNTYINNLRINYFISRYMKAVAAGKSVVAQELADESGFGSYRTFSRAFTERMGQSVTDWMRNAEG